jgi:hypothetical protein
MNIIISKISSDIIIHSLTNITRTFLSTNLLYGWFINQNNKNYDIYKNKIISLDLNNKLLIIESLIINIIKKYYEQDILDIDINIININENIITEDTITDDFTIINYNDKFNLFTKIPEPVKISLISNLEIINLINYDLSSIKSKIDYHNNSFFYMLYNINIDIEINKIYYNTLIFEKRINLLFQLLQIYIK